MREQERVMFILMPFRPELEPVKRALQEVAKMTGFSGITSKEASEAKGGGNLSTTIIEGIYEADLLVADLTYLRSNVLWELGVAHALNKSCLMICQKDGAEPHIKSSWVTSLRPEDREGLPFDLETFDVTEYSNDHKGLETLKDELTRRISKSRGAQIRGPVNIALGSLLKRNRLYTYLLCGAGGGLIFSIASLVTAFIGHSFVWHYHATGPFFRTLIAGAAFGLIGGAGVLGVYSLYDESQRKPLRRHHLILGEMTAGIIVGLIASSFPFILAAMQFGPATAFDITIPHVIMTILGFTGMALTLNIQPPLAPREKLSSHMTRAILVFLLLFTVFVVLINLFKVQIFSAQYLERYEVLDSISDALRYAIWGIAISTFQWWLKWERRL